MRPPCLVAFLCSVFLSAVQPPHLTIPSPLSKDPVSELSAMCHFNLSELLFMHSSCPLYALCSALPQVPVIGNVVRASSSNWSHGPRQGLPQLIPFTPYPLVFIRTTAHRPSHQQLFVRALLPQLPKEGADCLGLPTSLFLIADSSGLKHPSHTINSAPPDPYLSHEPYEPMACPSVCLSVHSRDGEPPLPPSSTGHSWARETGRRRL
ncbi:uncharacterized protein CCOS01_09781 [Colletotrichum costaricense]|uniref:Uncharacterized protein n=1 Tax=Colletotrichum costaricense TaxID=1209916 RepID=A0AAJ0DYV9_9PEZI|nr:uncharacterized protein CCOS01_09781 [Colletotrichum costaricense]KAK1522069.1 hypothetical protein CCOS01_09781 [Colletotrichum costaricense]